MSNLKMFDHEWIWVKNRGGNFLTVKFGDRSADINQDLLQNGVIVRPLANYAMPEYLRISVGTRAQLEKMFTLLEKLL